MVNVNSLKGYTQMRCKLKVFRYFFTAWASALCVSVLFISDVSAEQLYTKSQQQRGSVTGLEIPRFVTLRSDKVFLRSGPAVRYPVNWVYNHQNYPVEITQEFDTWRKVRDASGTEGWVHQSLITGRRYVWIKDGEIIQAYRAPDLDARVTMRLEPGAIAKLLECNENWCKISAGAHEGWTHKKHIWGVYASDRIK